MAYETAMRFGRIGRGVHEDPRSLSCTFVWVRERASSERCDAAFESRLLSKSLLDAVFVENRMRHSRIVAKLSRNEPALCTALTLPNPELFELASLMGFDGIWLEMEHHGHSVETASQLMRAARVGVSDVVVRVAKGEYMRMGKLLEAGAQAIIYPRCECATEAADVVRWAKFAPLGKRGLDGSNADSDYGGTSVTDYIAHANRETLVIVQLEEQRAVDRAEEIAAIHGVDAIMLGPGDFSVLEGFPGEFGHARLKNVIRRISDAAKNTGKHWASTVGSSEQAQESLELGAKVLFHGADIITIRRGFEEIQTTFSKLGFAFGR